MTTERMFHTFPEIARCLLDKRGHCRIGNTVSAGLNGREGLGGCVGGRD